MQLEMETDMETTKMAAPLNSEDMEGGCGCVLIRQ